MKIKVDSVFLVISEDGNLIAKGTPRNRYICHIDEGDKKRFLTYSSKGRAENAFQSNGFYISDYTRDYIFANFPHLLRQDNWVFWQDIQELFIAKEFSVSYESL